MRKSTSGLLGACAILSLLLSWTTIIILSHDELDPEILSAGYFVENQAIYALRSNNFPYYEEINITEASMDHPTFLWVAIIFESTVLLTGQLWNELKIPFL